MIKVISTKQKSLRLTVKEIMEPFQYKKNQAKLSLYIDLFIIFSILASCALIPFEFIYPEKKIFWKFELFFTSVFIIEYGLRWYSDENRLKYPFKKTAIIDLIAILPTIILLIVNMKFFSMVKGIRLLRLLRLIRLLRLLKFIQYSFYIYKILVDIKMKISTIRDQNRMNQLEKIFFYGFIAWIVGANLLYFTENSLAPGQGAYGSYWKSYWHIIIVLFSGIEDKEPLTLLGRIEVTVLLIAGICFAGIITGEIVSILVKKIQRAGKLTIKPPGVELEQHIIIIGINEHLNNVVTHVNAALKSRNYIVIVCRDAENLMVPDPQVYKKVFALQGEALSSKLLNEMSLDKALRVIILSSFGRKGDTYEQKDNRTLMKTLAIFGRNSNIPVITELKSEDNQNGTTNLENVEFIVSRLFDEKLTSQAILNPGITEVYDTLMTFTDNTSEFYTIQIPEELVGKTFKEAQLYFLNNDEESIVLVGIDRSPENSPNTNFCLSPASSKSSLYSKDQLLKKNDRLILIAYEHPSFDIINEEDLWKGKVLLPNYMIM